MSGIPHAEANHALTFSRDEPLSGAGSHLHDFHERFLPHVAERIGAQLAKHYVVKIDEHVYIHEHPPEQRTFLGGSDVFVATRQPTSQPSAGTTTPEAPAQVELPSVDMERISYLEIRDRRDRRLVTVIELLSPTNKHSGPDRAQYLGKRGRVLGSSTHLVEIDLLRGGPRMPFAAGLPECAYYVMVSRMQKRPQADFWPIGLRDPLPVIPIPLSESDADAQLDLQAVLHHVYDDGRLRELHLRGRTPSCPSCRRSGMGQAVPSSVVEPSTRTECPYKSPAPTNSAVFAILIRTGMTRPHQRPRRSLSMALE